MNNPVPIKIQKILVKTDLRSSTNMSALVTACSQFFIRANKSAASRSLIASKVKEVLI